LDTRGRGWFPPEPLASTVPARALKSFRARAIVAFMRRTAIAFSLAVTAAAACGKKSETKDKPTTGSATTTGSAGSGSAGEVDTTPKPPPRPLPPLAKDPGGATGDPVWVDGFGGLATDTVRGVAVDPDGTTFVAGYFENECTFGALGARTPTQGKDHPRVVESDAFVMRIDNDGKPAWVQTWGSGRADTAYAVAVGKDGIAVGGNFVDTMSIGGMNAKSTNSDDLYVVGFDRKGTAQWLLTGGGVDSDGVNAIAATEDGGWIIAGSFADVAEITGTKLKSLGKTDAFLGKIGPKGDVEWMKSFGGPSDDTFFRVAVDAQGSIFVLGTFVYSASFGGETFKAAGNSDTDILLAKYDSTGNHVWSKRFGNTFNDVAGGLAVDPAGNVTFTGSFDESITVGDSEYMSKGASDVVVAKFTTGGDFQWVKTYGGDREDVGFGIAADAAGNLTVTGWFSTKVDFGKGELESPNLNKDVFLVKLDPSGTTLWQRGFGDKDNDQPRALALDGEGNATVGGIFRFKLLLPPATAVESVRKPEDKAPHTDIFVARFKR
jgi:hypothetical protein